MKSTIVGRKFTPDEVFTKRAQKKFSKLERFFGDDADAKLTISTEKHNYIVEITVNYSKMCYRAQETSTDQLEALDGCFDRLVSQIRRNKTKVEKRLRQGAFDQSFDNSVEEEVDFAVIRTKKIPVKPLTVDEAILEMNMLGHQFYVFESSVTGKTNVVYRRHDGAYGLLEPEA